MLCLVGREGLKLDTQLLVLICKIQVRRPDLQIQAAQAMLRTQAVAIIMHAAGSSNTGRIEIMQKHIDM